jgi:RNA polymerase sigma-70 factor (ECF subfamily)
MTTIPDDHGEAVFSAQRDRLVGVAYRITGSRSDAEDAVQEAWIRWSSAPPGSIDNPPGWLTTVTSRIALDHLRSAQQRREQYVGPWLPDVAGFEPAPDEQAEMAESLTMGFLAVLEHLKPIERAVFVLSDVYGVPYDEIGTVVDRRTDACRQIAHRARQKVRQERPRFAPTDPLAWSVAGEFVAALAAGDTDKVLAMLAPDVVHISDGGPDYHAARRPVVGADRVARLLVNLAKDAAGASVEPRLVNAQPGFVVSAGGTIFATLVCSVVDGRIDRIYAVVNPEKLMTFTGTGDR